MCINMGEVHNVDSIELSIKSSKIEYIYPHFCINLVALIRSEIPPPNMTTKLQ
jgi:hypothetical protein